MTLNEYQDWTSTLWLSGNSDRGVSLASIGLAGEAGEMMEVLEQYVTDAAYDEDMMVKEAGDFIYYVAQLSKQFSIPLSLIAEGSINFVPEVDVPLLCISLLKNVGKTLEVAKKHLRDGVFDKNKFIRYMRSTFRDYSKLMHELGLDVHQIMQVNHDKLEDRKARNVLHGAGDNR